MSKQNTNALHLAFCRADDEWQAELVGKYVNSAGDARYDERGKDKPGKGKKG